MGTKYYLNPDYTIRKDGNRYLLHSRFMKKYDFDSYGFFGPRSPYRVTEPLEGNHYILNEEAQTINIKDKNKNLFIQ